MTGSTKERRGSVSSLKSCWMGREPVQIHQKKSSKCKMQIIPDPDVVRICESYQKQCKRIRIGFPSPDSRIFMRTPHLHWVRTVQYGPPPPNSVGLQHFLCKGTYHLGHLGEARYTISRVIPGPWYYREGLEPPKVTRTIFFLTVFMVIP
jgi:hypothetical protein